MLRSDHNEIAYLIEFFWSSGPPVLSVVEVGFGRILEHSKWRSYYGYFSVIGKGKQPLYPSHLQGYNFSRTIMKMVPGNQPKVTL